MRVSGIMNRKIFFLSPEQTLCEAALLMKEQDIGIIPICSGTRIEGMVSDRDIVIRGIAGNLNSQVARVSEVMTPDVVYVYEDQDLIDVAETMKDHQVRRLIVLDRNKMLVGVVSLGDLALYSRNRDLTGDVLQQVSVPEEQHLAP